MSSALNGPDTVTGASGHLGSQVIESIVAITRAPGKRLAVQCRGRDIWHASNVHGLLPSLFWTWPPATLRN